MEKMKGRFKDEIRKSLILHALVPILCILCALLTAVFVLWGQSVVRQNEACSVETAADFERVVQAYAAQCDAFAAGCDPSRLAVDAAYRSQWSQELYRFVNHFSHRAEFYVLDAARNVVCASSQELLPLVERSRTILWGGVRAMHSAPDKTSVGFSPAAHGGGESLTIGRAVARGGETVGYILFVLPGDDFLRSISDLPAPVIVTDQFGHVFVATNYQFHVFGDKLDARLEAAEGYLRAGGELYYVSQRSAADGRVRVYAVTALNVLAALFLGVLAALAAVFFILGGWMFVSAKRIAARKTRIIDELVDAFYSVRRGDLDRRLHIATGDEFETIGEAYNIMLDSIKTLLRKNNEQTRQTVRSELRQLESQFDPHFLFNTLETVRFMVHFDPGAVDRMIGNLSKLLRYSIRTEKNAVTVEEDIEYIQNYLAILNCRFGKRFNYMIDIAEEAEPCVIPKLIFQPVIENAVKYGFAGRESMVVRIEAAVREGQLCIAVKDNGAGMDETALEEIRMLLRSKRNRTRHIGLFNVHRRLRLLYGDDCGIAVESEWGAGTTVRFTLPARRPDDFFPADRPEDL